MCSLQRIFHVLTKRQSFPSARRLLLGHGHGNHREPCDTPVGSLTYGLHPGQGARTSALYLAPRPTAPGGGLPPKPPPPARGAVAARKAHVCCPGHKQRTLPVSRQGPWCQPHGESQIVVVCLCLLKLGRENGLPVKTAWNVRPSAVQTALSASSGNGLEGLGGGPGLAQLAQQHAVGEGKPRDCTRTEVPSVLTPSCPLS